MNTNANSLDRDHRTAFERRRETADRALASLTETNEMGAATLEQMAQNAEKFRRIENSLDRTDSTLTHAERVERSLSFWGRVKNFCALCFSFLLATTICTHFAILCRHCFSLCIFFGLLPIRSHETKLSAVAAAEQWADVNSGAHNNRNRHQTPKPKLWATRKSRVRSVWRSRCTARVAQRNGFADGSNSRRRRRDNWSCACQKRTITCTHATSKFQSDRSSLVISINTFFTPQATEFKVAGKLRSGTTRTARGSVNRMTKVNICLRLEKQLKRLK